MLLINGCSKDANLKEQVQGKEEVIGFTETQSTLINEIADSVSMTSFNTLFQSNEIIDYNCSIIEEKSVGTTFIIPVRDSFSMVGGLIMGIKDCNGSWKVKYVNKLYYTLRLLSTQNIINHDFYLFLLSSFENQFCNTQMSNLQLRDDIVIDFGDGTNIIIDGNGVITWVVTGGGGICGGSNTVFNASVVYGSDGSIIWTAGQNNTTNNNWDINEDSGFSSSWSSFIQNNGGGDYAQYMNKPNYQVMGLILEPDQLRKMNHLAKAILGHHGLKMPIPDFWNAMPSSYAAELIRANQDSWNMGSNYEEVVDVYIFEEAYRELLFLKEIDYPLYTPNNLTTPAYNWLQGNQVQFEFLKNSVMVFSDDQFTRWAVDYFLVNPNTTTQQFENWFMGVVEGPDLGFDEAWWDNPSNNFAPQNLPTWADFDDAFPRIDGRDMTTEEIVNLVGGDVKTLANQNNVSMVCALKLSRALNYTGTVTIPNIPSTGSYPGTVEGADGQYYFMNAEAMNRWMRKVFGCANPNTSKGEYFNANALHWTDAELDKYALNVKNYITSNNIKGIYSAVAKKADFGASGHCDLINSDGTCVRFCYFNQADDFKWLDIWKLQ